MAFSQSYTKLLPMHVAFIMDGNRRWAKKKKLPVIEGHKMGSEIIKKIVVKSLKLGIKYLTFYSFSTENWNRSKSEVLKLQSLLEFYLDSELDNFKKKKINFSFIGDISRFSSVVRKKLINLKKITSNFSKLFFVLALGYGSRDEIIYAVKKVKKNVKKINENDISKNLMTSKLPDPDLVIRTSGEKRLSNFLLWQIAYSELYFTKTLWPDFNSSRYSLALRNYVISRQNFWKFSFLATKSVSEFISIITPLESFIETVTKPSEASRADFFCAVLIPFFLSHSSALSKSPSVSFNADLQSIIPAPVFSLSNLIFSGLTDITRALIIFFIF